MVLFACDRRTELCRELRRTMLGCLEEVVREVRFETLEIYGQRCESAVHGRFEKHFELRPVDLMAIDLLVIEVDGPDDRLRSKEFLPIGSEASIRSERSIFREPGTDRALGDVPVEASVQQSLGFGERVAEVERRDRLENEPKWVRLVFRWSAGETVQAFGALENLMDLETVPALAFLDDALAPTLWADGIRMDDSGG